MNILNKINYTLFKLTNKRYLKLINKLIFNDTFKKLVNNNTIKIYYLEKIDNKIIQNDIFKISNGKIIFLHKLNLIQFKFNKTSLPNHLRYLININIKNLHTYTLIKSLEVLQQDFLYSNNILKLKYISHKDILSYYHQTYNISFVSSNISTIINNTTSLKTLLPKKHCVLYNHIQTIINIDNTASDLQIKNYLKDIFNINTNIKNIFNIRKRYNIPSRYNRTKNIYIQYSKNFSQLYELTYHNIINLKNIKCVYELVNFNTTVYIGSTKDLKRRLTQYINGLGHTQKIKEFIKSQTVSFRYISTLHYKILEKDIFNAFYNQFNKYPILNCNRIL